jgi:hypothetical protein
MDALTAKDEGEKREAAETPALLTAAHFEPHVGKPFRFQGARHVLTLDRVIAEGEARAGLRRPFTLIFSGARERDVLP